MGGIFKQLAKQNALPAAINAFTSILSPSSPHVLQNKESMLTFLNYLQNIPLEHLKDDAYALKQFALFAQNPEMLFTRASQLTLETFYSKRVFKEPEFHHAFAHKKLSIVAFVGHNNHMVDSSTIYIASQVKHMLNSAKQNFIS